MTTKQKTPYLVFDDGDIIVQDLLHPQCYELLAALRRKPMTDLQIRQELCIFSPRRRLAELLDAGYYIARDFITVTGPNGCCHSVAQYSLIHWYEG